VRVGSSRIGLTSRGGGLGLVPRGTPAQSGGGLAQARDQMATDEFMDQPLTMKLLLHPNRMHAAPRRTEAMLSCTTHLSYRDFLFRSIIFEGAVVLKTTYLQSTASPRTHAATHAPMRPCAIRFHLVALALDEPSILIGALGVISR
jgi:hypothetical protein